MYGEEIFSTNYWAVGLLVFLAGCQQVEDEVSIRSENVGFASEPLEKVTIKAAELATNPINAAKRQGIEPEVLEIPAIGIQAAVEHMGTMKSGEMAVPKNPAKVSWFSPGYEPGANGRAVLAGHVDGVEGPAVFWDLSKLRKGDEIRIKGEGQELVYRVHTMESIPLDLADVAGIFGYASSPELVLITCSGAYDYARGTREERLIIYASLIE